MMLYSILRKSYIGEYQVNKELLFLFISPEVTAGECRTRCDWKGATLHIAGSSSYEDAVGIAKEYVDSGVTGIELCALFGNKGVSMISDAVGEDIPVGVVRFDHHPFFGDKSGDIVMKY